jgi:hypothetical protein
MQPFFLFYGGKWRLAERLGPPQRDHVIEPFAGSAGYSVFWEPKKVTLIERDPLVYGVWKYLQRVSPAELKRLPSNISDVDDLPSRVCDEAKSLVGFWFNHGLAGPAVPIGRAIHAMLRFSGARPSSCVLPVRSSASDIGKSSRAVGSSPQTYKRIGTSTLLITTTPGTRIGTTALTTER